MGERLLVRELVREAVMEGDAPTDKLGVGEALSVPLALLVAVTDVV